MKSSKLITTALTSLALCNISFAESEQMKKLPGNPAQLTAAGHEAKQMDGYFIEDGKLMVRKDRETSAVTSDLELKDGSVVMANGTIKTPEGHIITLQKGDMVSLEGKIWKPDYLVHKDGKMFVRRDGEDTPMTETVVISDGTKVMTDGTYMMKDGTIKKLGSDQQIDWDGRVKSSEIVDSGPPGKL